MTGKELLEHAIDLCGLRATSADMPTDVSDLEIRALMLINVLLGENSILDCKIKKVEHEVKRINNLNDRIDCCDIVAQTVLPYGLARLFMLGEDDELALRFEKLYEEARKNAITFGKAKALPITEVYE